MTRSASRAGIGDPGSISPVDFANSIACPACRVGDALASEAEARRWIRVHGPQIRGRVSAVDARRLRRFRASVRSLLGSAILSTTPPAHALREINRAWRRAVESYRLEWHRGRWSEAVRVRNASVADQVAGRLARSLVRLLSSPDVGRLRMCAAPECVHLLLSRTRQQLWCSSTGCGNRVRVARHYRKWRMADGRRRPSAGRC